MNQDRFEEMVMPRLDKLREEVSTIKSDIAADISNIKSDIAWMKGKLEGRAETRHVVLTAISIFIAICAVVVAIFK